MLTNREQNLVLAHLPFADSLAKSKFRNTPPQVSLDDLKSAAYMGLVDAAGRYDWKSDFKNFARWRILGEMQDYLRSLRWDCHNIKVESISDNFDLAEEREPESFDELLDDLSKNRLSPLAKRILRMYYGERLTISEIAEKVNLSGARVSQLLKENLATIREAMSA